MEKNLVKHATQRKMQESCWVHYNIHIQSDLPVLSDFPLALETIASAPHTADCVLLTYKTKHLENGIDQKMQHG